MSYNTNKLLNTSLNLAMHITISDINTGFLVNPNNNDNYRISMHNSVAYELRKHKEADVIVTFFTTKKGINLAYIALFTTIEGVH